MKTTNLLAILIIAGLVLSIPCAAQVEEDSILAAKAYGALQQANKRNGATIGFGVASNIEMLIIGGFPLELDGGTNPGANLTHMALALGRVTTSFLPAPRMAKACKIIEPWRERSESSEYYKKLFAKMDAARVLTAAAPVLCISGGVMMFAASTNMEYTENYSDGIYETNVSVAKPGLKAAGWICVGAGLAASITSVILINDCKRDLSEKMGKLSVSASASGVGLYYNLPDKN